MAHTEPITSIGSGLLRLAAAVIGRKAPGRAKYLKSRIVMRGIVAELPAEFPFKIVDPAGTPHRGVYALNVLIWNRGTQEITPADFLDSAPLGISVGESAYIIMADCLSNDDQIVCSAASADGRHVDVHFDCLNPGDHLNIILYYGGQSMADIAILGRIRGQETSLDHQAEEVKATFAERLACLLMLAWIVDAFVGMPASAWLIYTGTGFSRLLDSPPVIPATLQAPFWMGIVFFWMLIQSRIGMWWERRKYPPGYPLHADFEPPFFENVKGMVSTVFTAKRHHLSTSMFDWAKPVIVTGRKNRRLTVNDWMR